MDFLKTFIFNDLTHNVRVVRNDDNDTMYCASDIGTILGIKNIKQSIQDFDEDEKNMYSDIMFLSEQGMYKLIMRSKKVKAKSFQKWVFNSIKDIRKNGMYELQKELDELKFKYSDDMKDSIKLFTKYNDEEESRVSKILVDDCKEKTVVYYGKIKTVNDGRFLIKIGCTKNMKVHLHDLKQNFENMNMLKVFECDKHLDFERFLHDRCGIKEFKYNGIINGIKVSNGVFLFTGEQIKKAFNITERNAYKFRIDNNKREIDEIVEENPQVTKKSKIIDEEKESTKYEPNRGHKPTFGDKVQKYNENLELIETYSRIIEVMRVKQHSDFSWDGIHNAIVKKTLYKGFRWASLDKNLPDETIQDIGETCVKNIFKTGYAVTLTRDGKSIVKVYSSFNELGISEGFKGSNAVLKRMNNNKPLDDGRILKRYSDLEPAIKDEWLKNNELPVINNGRKSIGINRLDPNTKEILETFSSQNEVSIKYGIDSKTLKSVISGNIVQRKFRWSYVS